MNYRKRVKIGDGTYANISKSGVSISQKVGNVTVNSRGGTTVNLGNGVVWKSEKKKKKSKANPNLNQGNNFLELMLMQQMMSSFSDNSNKQKGKKGKNK